MFIKSLYEPLVATVANAELSTFNANASYTASLDTAFELPSAMVLTTVGMVGLLLKSAYEPLVATVAKLSTLFFAVLSC